MDRPKNFLEDISNNKPESFKEEVFVPARKSPVRLIVTIAIAAAVLIIALVLLQLRNVKVPDMSAWQLSDVQTWASKYHDNTILNGVYSKEVALNGIISQDVSAGKRIKGSSALTITYSLGADPDEAITLPDIKNMKLTDINSWISDNQLSGVTVQTEANQIVPKDSVISYEFVDGSQDQFLRKNRMIIYVSSGTASSDTTVDMPDLIGKTKAEVMQWAEENNINVTIDEEFNQYVDYGKAYAQNITAATKITGGDAVTVNISRGQPITVPDFTGMSRTEASDLATLNKISIFYKMVISSSEADSVLGQDITAGTQIDSQQIITLQIAKQDGKSVVPNFIGLTASEADKLAGLYNIKLFTKNSDQAGNSGIVASQSVTAGAKIDDGQVMTVTLKENNESVLVPNFVGMTKNEASVAAQNLGIQLLYNEVQTSKSMNDTIIKQNIKVNQHMGSGDTIILDIAVNSGIKADYMWKMNLKEAQAWATRNGINLNVIDYYSSDYDQGVLYDQDTAAGEYIPANKILTVYHSLGLVLVDNFIGKTKSDILKWQDDVNSKGARIALKFTDDANTTMSKGTITDQSTYGDLVPLNQTIQVSVSATSNGVIIKSFDNVSLDDFKYWCDTNSIHYVVTDVYSDTMPAGQLFGQNYTNTYLPKGEYLKIYHSLGKVYVDDFSGMTKSQVVDWQKDVNSKGADIKITFSGTYSTNSDKGKVLDQSIQDALVDLDGSFVVSYSLGGL